MLQTGHALWLSLILAWPGPLMLMMLAMRTLWALADIDLGLAGAADARDARSLGSGFP